MLGMHPEGRGSAAAGLKEHLMETVSSASPFLSTTLVLSSTQPTEFIDLTERVVAIVAASGIRAGIVNVQSLHTTTAIVVNEHEPLLLADFVSFLEEVAPCDAPYQHDDWSARRVNIVPGERRNGHAHCRALLLPTSACLNIVEGRLQLGRWQRVFLVELDGPLTRQISVLVLGTFGKAFDSAQAKEWT